LIVHSPPECLKSSAPEYADWVALGKPDCWCYRRQCKGDIDGATLGPFPISIVDLNAFKQAFNKIDPLLPAGGECADLDHTKAGPFRISIIDLNTFKSSFNNIPALVPQCDLDGDGVLTGADKYNFWTN